MKLFLQYWSLSVGALLTIWLLGRVLFARWLDARHLAAPLRSFMALMVGLVAMVVPYAAWYTGGVTVLLPLLVLVPVAVWLVARPSLADDRPAGALPGLEAGPAAWPGWLHELLLLVGGATLILGARFQLLYDATSAYLRLPYEDFIFYSRAAAALPRGVETCLLEFNYPQFVTENPYHYLELWLTTLFAHVSGLPTVFTLYLVTYSLLLVLVWLGGQALLAVLGVRQWYWQVGVATVLLVTTGVYWPFFNRLGQLYNLSPALSNLLPIGPKLLPVYLLLQLGAIALVRRRYLAVGLALAGLPIVFITTGPGVLSGTAVMAFVAWWRLRSPRQAATLFVPAVLVTGFVGLFYVLQPAAARVSNELGSVRDALPKTSEVVLLVKVLIGNALTVGVYFLPFIVLVVVLGGWGWWAGRAKWQRPADWVLIGLSGVATAVLTCLGVWVVSIHYLDSFQFFSNLATPLLVLSIFMVVGQRMAGLAGPRRALLLAGLAALAVVNLATLNSRVYPMHITSHYAPQFLSQVGPRVRQLAHYGGGFWIDDSHYRNVFDLMDGSHIAGAYTTYFVDTLPLPSLSALVVDSLGTDPRFKEQQSTAKSKIMSTTLFRFHELEDKVAPADSVPLDFARRKGLRLLCEGPGSQLPPFWNRYIQQRYTDPVSGESLCVLRPWPGQPD